MKTLERQQWIGSRNIGLFSISIKFNRTALPSLLNRLPALASLFWAARGLLVQSCQDFIMACNCSGEGWTFFEAKSLLNTSYKGFKWLMPP